MQQLRLPTTPGYGPRFLHSTSRRTLRVNLGSDVEAALSALK